jgi:predicted oxidoreductase
LAATPFIPLATQEREKYVIATKCGIIFDTGGRRFDGSRAHVRSACEASLKRLGIDYIDLYYLHSELMAAKHGVSGVVCTSCSARAAVAHLALPQLVVCSHGH